MDIDDIKRHYGSFPKAAQALGLVRQAVYGWKLNGIPALRQIQIERATKGRLKADPACYGTAITGKQGRHDAR